jgi:hypothetical protein
MDAIEVYRGRAIFYGLGELFFRSDSWAGTSTRRGLVVEAEVSSGALRSVSCKLVSRASDTDDRPVVRDPVEDAASVERLVTLSAAYGTSLRVEAGSVVVDDPTRSRAGESAVAGTVVPGP